MSKRWETTIWKASPARISSLAASTMAQNSSEVRCRLISAGWAGTSWTAREARGEVSARAIAWTASTAPSWARSTPSSVPSKLMALAISQSSPRWWSRTATSLLSIITSSGRWRSSSVVSGSRSSRRTTS